MGDSPLHHAVAGAILYDEPWHYVECVKKLKQLGCPITVPGRFGVPPIKLIGYEQKDPKVREALQELLKTP